MTRQVVFAGPSLYGAATRHAPDIAFHPPAAKGDILTAVRRGTKCIGIIDGTFDHGAAIWHKEILYAIDQGVTVLGAASMGALRAAECAAFGMIGIGRIYQQYAQGHRRADADVALVHGPAELGFAPLTDALVDVEATLERLLADDLLTEAQHRLLADLARGRHFKERRWSDLCAAVGRADLQAAFFSQKRADAVALIDAMQEDFVPHPCSVVFNETMFFRDLAAGIADLPPAAAAS